MVWHYFAVFKDAQVFLAGPSMFEEEEVEGYKSPSQLQEFENKVELRRTIQKVMKEMMEEKKEAENEQKRKEDKKKEKKAKQKNKGRRQKGGVDATVPREKSQKYDAVRKAEARAKDRAARGITAESKPGHPFILNGEQEECLIKKVCERVCFFLLSFIIFFFL